MTSEATKNKTQMAAEYGITPKTFSKRLKNLGIEIQGYCIFPKQQQEIYEKLGTPSELEDEATKPNPKKKT